MLHMDLIVSSIIDILKKKGKRAGKIQIQKCVYFLKNMGIKVPYSFQISHYGPYSADLSKKITDMEFEGVIEKYDNRGYDYKISSQYTDSEIKKNLDLHNKIKENMEELLQIFPKLDFKTLELYSTVHYCYKALENIQNHIKDQDLIDEVKRWKGKKFSKEEIVSALKIIKEKELL